MIRLVPAVVLLTAGLLPTAAAHAVTTCQGETATIEASSGQVTGTPLDDVIVVTGSVKDVEAGDGDDLICAVDSAKGLRIVAGPGDDVVDASASNAQTTASLGAGADRYIGSDRPDSVLLGNYFAVTPEPGDPGPDVVRTFGGKDELNAGTGVVVDADLGKGDDGLSFSGDDKVHAYAGPGSVFDLGSGTDQATFDDWWESPDAYDTTLRVDLTNASVSWHEVESVLRSAEDVRGAARRVIVRGDAHDNEVYVNGCTMTVRGGRGDDRLLTGGGSPETAPYHCTWRGRVYGQAGDDYLSGTHGDDVLIGGPGYDLANGGRGNDRCVAERSWGSGCR